MGDSTSRLEPFILLARSTKGAAAEKVIQDATAATGVYTFTELLNLPNIQALVSDPSGSKSVKLLELFAFGTLETYRADESSYPPLTSAQLQKLKHLTLVSLALHHRSLSYSTLLTILELDSVRQLEELIIDSIYAELLTGKMHHHEQILHVDWVSGRDLRPEDLVHIQKGLETWCQTALTLVQALDDQIALVRQNAIEGMSEEQTYKEERMAMLESLMKTRGGGRQGLGPPGAGNGLDDQSDDVVMRATGAMAGLPSGKKTGLNRRGQGSAASSEELGRTRGSNKRLKDSP
ncbi:hypothetical protein BD324DRAFT_611744 [Kockovaella imperatae]|uniref:PCI domain-containing protein n=1 Tax=Kockovaella imperatae TaxID=4999 RepID=A0A1Y1UTC6_9TREE|nr:hypothetical protein BD324DRAFT_611744 [Kockovaella imperatae]ORX40676.1 hypothetical protein BD324DRAFT_611744 [Kockovaella imperatae]